MVRQATVQDLPQVVAVHIQCFPNSFSTALGKKLLVKFYTEYISNVPELFLVAEQEGKICGFCMGYYCEENPYMKRFFKHNLFAAGLRIAGQLFIGNKAAWKKLTSVFSKKAEFKPIGQPYQAGIQDGDLLSICVQPQTRGSGAAQALIETYEQVLKDRGRKYCRLTVAVDNPRAIRFYERNGYVPFKEAEGIARSYIKPLE